MLRLFICYFMAIWEDRVDLFPSIVDCEDDAVTGPNSDLIAIPQISTLAPFEESILASATFKFSPSSD